MVKCETHNRYKYHGRCPNCETDKLKLASKKPEPGNLPVMLNPYYGARRNNEKQ